MQTIQSVFAQATQIYEGRHRFLVAITLAERFIPELTDLFSVQCVSYPACFNKIRLT